MDNAVIRWASDALLRRSIEQDGWTLGGVDEGKFGIVGYTHAGGIDQPLAIHRQNVPGVGNVTLVPHANWQGDYMFATKADGTQCATTCYNINWPGGKLSTDEELPSSGTVWWFGSLIGHQGDGSGLQYMRNRYYDPKTGRFTQEDPIGLGGGINLYGLGGGNPVSFRDPFGLSPRPRWGDAAGIPDQILLMLYLRQIPLGIMRAIASTNELAISTSQNGVTTSCGLDGSECTVGITIPPISGASLDLTLKWPWVDDQSGALSVGCGYGRHLGAAVSRRGVTVSLGVNTPSPTMCFASGSVPVSDLYTPQSQPVAADATSTQTPATTEASNKPNPAAELMERWATRKRH